MLCCCQAKVGLILDEVESTVLAPSLIHPNQAGFMKGRKISDQIFLAINMAEHVEDQLQDGVILALDQQKAYDKTSHHYLWEVMAHNGLPEKFINTVKALYKDAETRVVINGELSSPFRVKRGVRQGTLSLASSST
jgi:hypothetical protein